MKKTHKVLNFTFGFIALLFSVSADCLAQQPEGEFWRTYWYQRGMEFGNPGFANRFHVNSPESVLQPQSDSLIETRENGLMLIPIREDLKQILRAELYAEVWGGQPGTANKRVSINGRNTYPIQEIGTFNRNCTYQYPTIYLQITDLVNGYNAIQFACDRGQTLWGNYIVDNAAIRVELKREHPDLRKSGLMGFNSLIKAEAVKDNPEIIRLLLISSDESIISSVDYQGFYYGYDENGDTLTYGWHGMTRERKKYGYLGSSDQYPFSVNWDTSMLPSQQEMAVRAIIHFKNHPELEYITPVIGGLFALKPRGSRVLIYSSRDLPIPFWSRMNQKKSCTIDIDMDPANIERAELNVVVRDGGSGSIKNYFTLNGQSLAVASEGKEQLLYSKIPIDPKILKKGSNKIEVLSDTDHHGLEILLPGPALVIRSK